MRSDTRHAEMLRRTTSALNEVAASAGWAPDFEWFASDRDGHIAVLTTAGLGPVPSRVLADPIGRAAVWEALEEHGIALGLGELEFEGVNTAPKVGAFAFDYSGEQVNYGQYSAGQAYRRVGTPHRPLARGELGTPARSFLAEVCFRDACFAEVDSLVVEDAFHSIHRPTTWNGANDR